MSVRPLLFLPIPWLTGLLPVVIACLMTLTGCGLLTKPPTVTSVHLSLGNPSNAAGDPDNYLLVKPQYALSYNNSTRIPNWVSWQLNQSWLGKVPRRNDFRPDESLPPGWYQVVPSDYNNSGFDRGHMTPSADRSNNQDNNSATFLMTNILPQAPDNNQGPWAELEVYCRELARQGQELYIVAGGYGRKRAIARGKIVAPARTWKVIVVLDQPGQGVADITSETRVIAVDMPNNQGIKTADWRSFRVSVDQVEAKTGYDLLSNLPESVQQVVEGRVDAD